MEHTKIYQKIQSLAAQLEKEHGTYTRADLAYELKELGIKNDSQEVSRLIMEAYEYFNKSESIRKAFINNEGNRYVVDECLVPSLLEMDNVRQSFEAIRSGLQKGNQSLHALDQLINDFMKNVVRTANPGFLATLTGTRGVNKVQSEAQMYFNGYSYLMDCYANARSDVKATMVDFVQVRGYIADIYREYAMKLTDIYGDSIKSVAPQLFDFDQVQFLDVEGMLKSIKLEYDQLSENCAALIGEITENFSQSLSESVRGYKSVGGKGAGLIIAGAGMLNHYLSAQEKTTQRKRELEVLKQNIKHDVTTIKGDYGRLSLIYKTLNDLYIPKANAFYRYNRTVMDDELQQLFATLYRNEKISALVKQRDEVLARYKTAENNAIDNRLNIDYYTDSIARAQELLQNSSDEYHTAISAKPSKPSGLSKLFSFGSSEKNYNRDMFEWKQHYAPVIREYENYQVDIKIDKEELEKHRAELTENERILNDCRKELKRLNQSVMSQIKASDETKWKMAAHLESIIKLLHIAKDIAESKLDDRYIRTVQVTDYRNAELPAHVEDNLHRFTQSLKDNLAPDLMNRVCQAAQEDDERTYDEETISQMTAAQDQAIQQGMNVLEEWSKLQLLQQQGRMAGQAYDRELRRMQKQFDKAMAGIDNKRAALAETLKRINTASDPEALKKAMLELGGNGKTFSKDDLEQFLSGTKTIEI